MITKTVTYTDYDGEEATETLHFNLSRVEIEGLLDLRPRLVAWKNLVDGPERKLSEAEVREFLDIIKEFVKRSYGIRDGKRFRKSPEIYLEFTETGAYDEFLWNLMNDPEACVTFITSIAPQQMLDDALDAAQQSQNAAEISVLEKAGAQSSNSPAPTSDVPIETVDNRPAYVRERRKATQREFMQMNKEEQQAAFLYDPATA